MSIPIGEHTPIKELDISNRVYNGLRNGGIVTVCDLVQKTDRELLLLPNFGKICLAELKDVLRNMGLSLGMKIKPITPWFEFAF